MKFGMAVVLPLIVFDVVVAAVTTLGLIPPIVAGGLLLTNPVALFVDHWLRGRRRSTATARS
jgi:uncharacterized membrane protein YphA (DoxX/SURF4 family)